jgi:hypothetical protein
MDKKHLQELLAKLHGELEKAERVDDATRAALAEVTDDIRRLLASEEPASREQGETLAGRMQESLLEFETEHPAVTRVINQMAAALANLGI